MTKEQKVKKVREFRSQQNRDLMEFCKRIGVCCRCRSPHRELETNTMCGKCAGYSREYAKTVRAKSAKPSKAAPAKSVAKKPTKPVKAAPKKGQKKVVKAKKR